MDAAGVTVHAPHGPHCPTWQDYVAVFLWLGWLNIYSGALAALGGLLWSGHPRAALAFVVAPFGFLCVFPRDDAAWGHALGKWIMFRARRYFHLTVVHEAESALAAAAARGPLVLALEPHDILPFSIFAFSKYLGLVPGRGAVGLMSGVVFRLPGMKQVYRWVSAGSVGRANFVRELERGNTVSLVPGGVREVLAIEPAERDAGIVALYLKKRKGFLKLALDHDAAVAPAYCFGLEKTYDAAWPSGPLVSRLSRKLGFVPLYYHGFPRFAPFGIPRPAPLTVVVGAPLAPPPADAPDRLGAFHAAFCAAMEALVARHKGERSAFGEALTVRLI